MLDLDEGTLFGGEIILNLKNLVCKDHGLDFSDAMIFFLLICVAWADKIYYKIIGKKSIPKRVIEFTSKILQSGHWALHEVDPQVYSNVFQRSFAIADNNVERAVIVVLILQVQMYNCVELKILCIEVRKDYSLHAETFIGCILFSVMIRVWCAGEWWECWIFLYLFMFDGCSITVSGKPLQVRGYIFNSCRDPSQILLYKRWHSSSTLTCVWLWLSDFCQQIWCSVYFGTSPSFANHLIKILQF